uniref:Uncharacterized protein n=1 Tax=Arion vulgaris TaxID=1028688 RepID=A0A0B6ZCU2_9EUPU
MDIGLAFDDDDLNTTREKSRDIYLPYDVKTCIPQWFESVVNSYENDSPSASTVDLDQIPHLFKFSGDYHYHLRNYEKAAERYKRSLDLLPENNVSVRQDVKESLCRCYLYCEHVAESLQMARDLVSEMSGEDEAHQRQSLILLSSVCEKAERWAECTESLEKLCTKQAYFAQSWDQLGDAYMKLHINQPAAEDIPRREESFRYNEGDNVDPDAYLVKQLTCYIRASLLLQSVMSTASSFIKTRNGTLIAKLSEKISNLHFSETKKAFAFQYIQEEIENQEDYLEDKLEISKSMSWHETSADAVNLSYSQQFYNKFCSWYLKSQT